MSIERSGPGRPAPPLAGGRPGFRYAPALRAAQPVVTIVTPFYEAGEAFRETAASVFGQSLQEWEWVIVNDASPSPQSRAVLDEVCRSDERVRVLEHETNRGGRVRRATRGLARRRPAM